MTSELKWQAFTAQERNSVADKLKDVVLKSGGSITILHFSRIWR